MHQLSAEEVVKLNSRCAALSENADQVLATRHSMCMIDVKMLLPNLFLKNTGTTIEVRSNQGSGKQRCRNQKAES
jgi:hypothetical protein